MDDFANKIQQAIKKFSLDMQGKIILTEAASGNYRVTPVIAAAAGAKKVWAFTKNSSYASVDKVIEQTMYLAREMGVEDTIEVVTDFENMDFKEIDIVTNTGFLRPIDKNFVEKLSPKCVIPLMWETWEYRQNELDLETCLRKGIKVYGTNEDDPRLRTKEYIGYTVLNFLLERKHTPITSKVLLLGGKHFGRYVENVLKQNRFSYSIISDYSSKTSVNDYDVIVILEHQDNTLLIGENGFIENCQIRRGQDVIHICGNVDFSNVEYWHTPDRPASFGYMSYTADYMGCQAVIDLHAAGLKVAEGMLEANKLQLSPRAYKEDMEKIYPAMAFDDERFW